VILAAFGGEVQEQPILPPTQPDTVQQVEPSPDTEPDTINEPATALPNTPVKSPTLTVPSSATTPKTEPAATIMTTQVKVATVVDGDTIKVSLAGKTESIRLIGVDTPETVHPSKPVEPYGPEASQYTKTNLEGKTIWLEFDVEERDRYGRLLAYAWLNKPLSGSKTEAQTSMFNALLLLNGYAQISTYPPNVKYVDYFTQFQEEARNTGRGLWDLDPSTGTPSPSHQPEPNPVRESPSSLSVISYTENTLQGEIASITIQGKPNTEYVITVTYKSGPSQAQGLEPQTSNASGKVTWSWKVGSRTTPGPYPIEIKGGGESTKVYFTVK
jgi:micrococcal nuclease